MRFLTDENVEQVIVDALIDAGHDILRVRDVARGARDIEIVQIANADERILLTNDKGFGDLVYQGRRVSYGILLLRVESEDALQKAALLINVVSALGERLCDHFAVITEERYRLRPLR